MKIEEKIRLLTRRTGKHWGIYAKYLNKDIDLGINEDKSFEIMSIIKLPILVALFKKVDQGKINLNQEVKIRTDLIDNVGSGILKYFSKGPKLRIYDIALLMMIVSDNSATNVLIKLLGQDYINRFLGKNGFKNTQLVTNRISAKTFSNSKKYGLGRSTPREITDLFEKTVKGKVVSAKSANQILRIMKGSQFGDVPLYIPYWQRLGDKKNKIKIVSNKTGSCTWEKEYYFSVRNETAYIKTKKNKEFIITVFAEGKINDHIWTDLNEISKSIARIAELIYNHFDSIINIEAH